MTRVMKILVALASAFTVCIVAADTTKKDCSNGTECCVNYIRRDDGLCHPCENGTFGVKCTQRCPRFYYGRCCERTCNCSGGFDCDPRNGRCDYVGNYYRITRTCQLFMIQLLIGLSLLIPVSTVRTELVSDEYVRELVRFYFNMSFSVRDICGFLLFTHHIIISQRTVKRIMRALGLRRRGIESNLEDVIRKIIQLHRQGHENYGYKAMWKHLNSRCGIRVTQNTVRHVLKAIDPTGVDLRSRNCLRRRLYTSLGPHFVIHVDGYDKLKPFGIAIHGAIDGFSRRILWLRAGPTNKDPRVVADYFIDYLTAERRLPRVIRCDGGSENVLMKDIQIALRSFHSDSMRGDNSVSVGRSTANQRIEMIWSFLKKHFTHYWRNLFKDMVDLNYLNNTDVLYLECIRFCFLPLIQQHLDSFKHTWNVHCIRSQRCGEVVSGIPNVLFHQPILYGASDCSFDFPCDVSVLQDIQQEYTLTIPARGCTEEFIQLVELVTGHQRTEFVIPMDVNQAQELYFCIISLIERYCY